MSFIDKDKYVNSFQLPHAPPIRKLFSSVNTEDGEANVDENDTFRVFLRIKPNSDSTDAIRIEDTIKLVCKPPVTSKFKKLERVEYTFSHIFGPKTTQSEIFSKAIVNCVEDLLFGRNSLIFAYGTTNAGKTFTVQGSVKSPGIIPQVLHTLFCNITVDQRLQYKPCLAKDILKMRSSTSQDEINIKNEILRSYRKSTKSSTLNNDSSHFMQVLQKSFVDLKGNKPTCSVWISFLEVYNETIFDLLDPATSSRKPLKLAADHSDNFYVKELKQVCVSSAEEAFTIYQFGKKNLNIASTKMNESSSRSHCIFTIHVINSEFDDQPCVSKLCICDLAGTERLHKTQNTGLRLKESGNINGSLFQLNRCLRAIRENQTKRTNQLIPYRHSNLTKLLHSALDDRTEEKIIMIVNINPAAELYDETQQVLKMCAIASKIKNKPITKKPEKSSRFTMLIYGRETNSVGECRNNELSDFEEDISKEVDDVEIQLLYEKNQRLEEEVNRLNNTLKIRETYYENTKKNLNEYCEKVETTYKSRVKSLEERLKSQKQYYIWKIEDVKKNTLLETVCDEAIKDEIFKKDAQIEELEKQLLKLQCQDDRKNLSSNSTKAFNEELAAKDAQIEELEKKLLDLQRTDQCRKLSTSEEIQEKEAKIKELESLIDEAKEEYLSLEKKYLNENAKVNELENELTDKNEMIEHFENVLNAKQNTIEDLELKVEGLEESLNQNTIDHEKILYMIEKQRDEKVASQKFQIEELNKKLTEIGEDWTRKLAAKESENAVLKKRLEELQKELATKKSEIEELASSRDKKLAMKESELEKLKEKFDRLVADQNCQLGAKEITIKDLNKKLKKSEEERDMLLIDQKSRLEESNKNINALQKQKDIDCVDRRTEIEESKSSICSSVFDDRTISIRLDKVHITEKDEEITTTKRYNTRRNNKTPSGKENRFFAKGTPVEGGSKSSRKGRGKAKTPLCVRTLDDPLEANVFRSIPETGLIAKDLSKSEKKKLFSSSPSPDPLPLTPPRVRDKFSSYSPSPDLHMQSLRDTTRFVEMTTPLQTVKLTKKKK